MASEVDICNNALIKLGNENTISQLGQDGREGETCQIMFPQVRDRLLAAHPWNFAIGRSSLIADTTSPSFEYKYQFYLPGDYMRGLKLYQSRERWKVEGDRLLTDESSPKLIYIKKETNTGKYPALFSELLAATLAAEMAEVITGSSQKANYLMEEAKSKLREAKRRDGQEGTPDNIQADAFTFDKDNLQWW